MPDRYILGQGKVYLDQIDTVTGLPVGKSRFVGNVPTGGFTITMQVQKIEHQESYTGQNLTDLVIERQKKAMGMIRMESIERENLAIALFGVGTALSAATVTAETHTAYKGYSFHLNRINLTSFTSLTNSAGDTTYVNGTDYLVDLKSGTVTILSAGTITDASVVKANYAAGASERNTAFSAPNKELWLRFNGVNNADGDKPVVLDAFKVRLQPAKTIDLINEQVTNLECDVEFLYQSLLDGVTGYEGGFFRFQQTAS